jgi:hypothetical protein
MEIKNMKKITIIGLLIAITTISACKKDNGPTDNAASLTIVDAVKGAPYIYVNFSPVNFKYSQEKTGFYYSSSMEFGLQSGSNPLNIVSPTDTSGTIFHGTLNLVTGGIYSLYLAGPPTKTDTVLMKDNIPYYANADSVAGARFINLCADSPPLSISQPGSTSNDFSGINYKKISSFKQYSAVAAVTKVGGYTYNITDAGGHVLTTFKWNPAVYRNYTLVISGLVSDGSISVFAVNNF